MIPSGKRTAPLYSLARRTLAAVFRDEIFVDASAMAFSLFLALIPLLALSGSLLGGVLHGDPGALSLFSAVLDLAPVEVKELVDRQLERGTGQAFAPLFLAGSLWLAAGAFHDAMTVCETALGAERRPWLKKRLLAIGCVVALLAIVVGGTWVLLAAGGGLTRVMQGLLQGAGPPAPPALPLLGGCLLGWLLLAGFFRIGVRHRAARPTIWPGATITMVAGVIASALFAGYARELASYTVFYGSLAAVAVSLIWLWVLCAALLVGVEVNAVLDRSRQGPGDSASTPL